MREEVKRWQSKAKNDLDTAEYLFKGKKYEDACLFCQQSVEKALKSVLLGKTKKIIKTHDLLFLADKVNLPLKLKENCKELTVIYVKTRYPDTPELTNTSQRAKKFLLSSKEILKWTKEQL